MLFMKTRNLKHFKDLVLSHYEFSTWAQKAIGKKTTRESLQSFSLDNYLQMFHCFDTYCYIIADSTSLKFVKLGGAIEQLTGYKEEEVLGKSYSFMLKVHRLSDNIRAARGGSMYFNYLYKQAPHKRPFIKVNRTLDLKCKDGTIKHVLVQSIPILFNAPMEPVYFLNIISDISDLKTNREYTHYILDSSDDTQIKKIALHTDLSMDFHQMEISKSELKVLRLMADGLSSKQIASQLFLSEHTVKNHRKNMLAKAECDSSSELVKRAVTEGWI